MDNRSIQTALTQAIRALNSISEDEIRELPLLDHSLILGTLPDMAPLANVRKQLAGRLRRRLDAAPMETSNIYELFLMLVALWKYNPEYISSEQFASAIERLIKAEASVGGPYYSGDTISIEANILIAIFMRHAVRPLPNLETFLDKIIALEHFEDTRFTSPILVYLLAEAVNGKKLGHYIAHQWQQGRWQTAERQAVALSILRNDTPASEINQALLHICQQQKNNGFWQGESLIRTAGGQSSAHIASTALVVKVLNDCLPSSTKSPVSGWQKKRRSVNKAAKKLYDNYTEPLRSSAQTIIDQVCAADKNFEVTLLPCLFANALKDPVALSDQQYTALCLASVYAWTAYTIYDDFLDSEGTPVRLPVANSLLRLSLDYFGRVLPAQPRFQQYVAAAFNEMDEANAWELRHCRITVQNGQFHISRLPRYGKRAQLAARSCAYTVIPRAILLQHPRANLRAMRHIEAGFRNYLIVRQLADDMEDWQADIKAGRTSYVVATILREMRIKPNVYRQSELLGAMQKQFRQTTMSHICRCALRHIEKARHHFAGSQLLRKTNAIYEMLDTLELSLYQSLDTQEKAQAILRTIERQPKQPKHEPH